MEYILFLRLINIIKKYAEHFNEKIYIYDNLINWYLGYLGDFNGLSNEDLKNLCYRKELVKIARSVDIKINENFIKILIFHFILNRRDIIVIKFLIIVDLFNRHIDIKCKFCEIDNVKIPLLY